MQSPDHQGAQAPFDTTSPVYDEDLVAVYQAVLEAFTNEACEADQTGKIPARFKR